MKNCAICIFMFLLIGACSNEEAATEKHVWETQTDALDKAGEVEELLHDAAEEQRKAIDAIDED